MKSKVGAQKERKELTPRQQKVKTAFSWIGTIVCIALIIFALVEAIFAISRTTNDDNVSKFGNKYYLTVASDSMEPTIMVDDMIIGVAYEGDGSDLQVGQVITFRDEKRVGGSLYKVLNTHRIVRIEGSGSNLKFYTKGDNAEGEDSIGKSVSDIVCTWGSVVEAEYNSETKTFTTLEYENGTTLKGLGAFANYMQDTDNMGESMKTRFFCIIVLPLIILFVIYAVVLIRTLVIAKLEKERVAKTEPAQVDINSLSDEEKQRLAMEYMAMLAAQQKEAESSTADSADSAPVEPQDATDDVADSQNETSDDSSAE